MDGCAQQFQCASGADRHTDPAGVAAFPVDLYEIALQLQAVQGAGLDTSAALQAMGLYALNLRPGKQALGVMAPLAAQQAAFHEDGGADAGAVLRGKALQVQDCASGVCHGSHAVAFAGDDLVLQFFADAGEISIIAGHPHQQVAVILGVLLGFPQDIGVNHVDLQGCAAVLDVTP